MLLAKNLSMPLQALHKMYHVCVVGGANEVGQTLSLLLRAQPSITKLSVHDVQDQTPGVILDLSHIPVKSTLSGYTGEETLERALKSANLVIATGGTIQKTDISKDSWLNGNAEFIVNVATKVAKCHPSPFFAIVTEPITSLVPMASEILRNNGEYNPKKLFGVTTIDALTAQSLYAIEHNLSTEDCSVPVIGGHSETSIVPLLSKTIPQREMDLRSVQEFTTKVRKANDMVTQAKKGWSPTLSVAYGALVFTRSILDALNGEHNTKVHAYVENNDFGTSFFSGNVYLNKDGVIEMQRYDNLSKYECHLLERATEILREEASKGKKLLEIA